METRNVGLNIQTRTPDEWKLTMNEVSLLAGAFGENGQYVSVWTSATNEEVNDLDEDGLKLDERTMLKVRATLRDVVQLCGQGESYVDHIIQALLEAGILFRERVQ